MKSIPAGKFKTECLALLDRLGPEGVVVTKHGKPVARVQPITQAPAERIGSLAGKIRITGRLLSTGEAWSAAAKR